MRVFSGLLDFDSNPILALKNVQPSSYVSYYFFKEHQQDRGMTDFQNSTALIPWRSALEYSNIEDVSFCFLFFNSNTLLYLENL
jgi:hypothetical protein